MFQKKIRATTLLIGIASLLACENKQLTPDAFEDSMPNKIVDLATTTQLKLKNLSGYPIGIHTENKVIEGGNATADIALKTEFNSLTVRLYNGELYTGSSATNWGTRTFTSPDKLHDFARTNGYSRFHGHCLVYHVGLAAGQESYISSLQGAQGTATFEANIRAHIEAIVNRYKTRGFTTRSYDVINEVIDDFNPGYRNTVFRQKYGSDEDFYQFIRRCFTWAKQADPAAKLFYNDYNLESSDGLKRQRVIALVNRLKNESTTINGIQVPIIDGIGFQSHVDIGSFGNGTNYTAAVTACRNTGLLVHLSELDVSINPADNLNASNYTELLKQRQSDVYRKVPAIYFSVVPQAQRFGITLWDLSDRESWIALFLRPNSNYDAATVLDANYAKKPAYWGFASGLAGYTLLPTNSNFSITPTSSTNVVYDAGANAQLRTNAWTNNNNQKWRLDHIGNGVYTIQNVSSNRFIRSTNGTTTNGTALTASTTNQQFRLTALDNGEYSITAGTTNQGFDRIGTNGNMQLFGYGGATNQKMRLTIQ